MSGEGKPSNRHREAGAEWGDRSLWIVAVMALGLACSCGLVAAGVIVAREPGIVRGSGVVITEDRPLGHFERVSLNHMGTLIISQGDRELLTVEADDNLLRYVRTEVRAGTLVLGLNDRARDMVLQPSQEITYRLKVRTITSLEVADSGRILAPTLEAATLTILAHDSGCMGIDSLTAHSLLVYVEDSADIRLTGLVERQDVTVQDSGRYLGGQLKSRTAAVAVSDSAEATLWATKALGVTATDSGLVRYYGYPKRTQHLSDNGRLIGLDAP